MPLIITKQSHTDHNIKPETLGKIVDMFDDKNEFFKGEFNTPDGEFIPCGLYGPKMGDGIVNREAVFMVRRGFTDANGNRVEREGLTPMVKLPQRMSNKFFIVGGPNEGDPCILYTCYGGAEAPREPWDPSLGDDEGGKFESTMFWKQHALAVPEGHTIVRVQESNMEKVYDRLTRAGIEFQAVNKAAGNHPVTNNEMFYLYAECSGNFFHRLVEDIADIHFEDQPQQ